ncbi:hypothetical protein IE53DRAFT_348536 [Violaceomyces palustris]|uniref:Uncharacterized protein n=1 Tax=Violaceomyces palustris TaxID=1673888 RepID=A0ACD0NPY1_9BASI|nr:hypothetical protein IE53DRAFT_348536 [Violaceomyces palustris]
MSSSRQPSGMAPLPGTGPSVVPATPARSMRKRNHLQLSAKQFDKMSRRLLAVQKSTGKHNRLSPIDPEGQLPTASDELLSGQGQLPPSSSSGPLPELGEGGQRRIASYIIEENEEEEAGPLRLQGERMDLKESTEYWLRRQSKVSRGLAQQVGRGPDGAALAAAAARGLKGKGVAPVDSFLHEGSFVFNPLNRRVPLPSPRKAMARTSSHLPTSSTSGPGASSRPPFVDQVPQETNVKGPTADEDIIPLSLADKEMQEALILEDLLFVLMGIEGQYIQFSPTYAPDDAASRLRGANFTLDSALDPSLKDLVERILPVATFFTSIYAFVEMDSSLEFGTVTHALCAAIRDLLKEYEILVVQLEHQLATSPSFTLQKLWFYVHPTLRTLSMVHSLTSEIASISHADLLEEDEDSDSSSGGSDADMFSNASQLERDRRALLGLDDPDEGIEGGIAKGGEILSMLWDRITRMSGDPSAHKLFTTLFHRASQPYARTLVKWISTGHLSDTYEEFMIMEDAAVTRASLESDPTDEYWERRYTLRDETMLALRERQRQLGIDLDDIAEDENATTRGFLTGGAKIPSFLEPWKHKILLAGKYLNVIRECGIDVTSGKDTVNEGNGDDQLIIMNDESFFRRIEENYQQANSTLLKLLIDDQHIVDRLRSLKHFLFLSESDFFMSFLDQSAHELRKKVDPHRIRETTQMRLQTHLGMVLGSSSSVGFHDPYREDVRVELASEGAYAQLKRIAETKGGIEAAKALARQEKARESSAARNEALVMSLIQFDVAVKFPVSLVISKKNILRWQFVHRCLVHLKILERSLSDVWKEHSEEHWKVKIKDHPPLERWKRRLFKLRYRMMFLVQQLLAFQTGEVLEPNWRDLESKMIKAKTVDQFMKDHFDFLNTCRKECMLTDLRYLAYHSRLTMTITVFSENRVRFRDQLQIELGRWEEAKNVAKLEGSSEPPKPALQESTLEFIGKIESNWDKNMKGFRDVVNLLSTTDNPAALPLSYRLQTALL